jgi:hypothetical protein
MEFPISFFLDYAWNTQSWNEDNLAEYYTKWAEEQFGPSYAEDIGEVVKKYSQYSARRKPELLSAETYSLRNYHETNSVADDYKNLLQVAEKVDAELPAEYKDAYFQLVLHPVKASANLNELYMLVALNKEGASRNWFNTNFLADKAKTTYEKDSLLSLQYHRLLNGKWNHMMDQTHIGYTYWQQPPTNKMPLVKYIPVDSAVNSEKFNPIRDPSAKQLIPKNVKENTFYELSGVVSMESSDWSNAIHSNKIRWKVIPDIGRTGSGISTFPVTVSTNLSSTSPHVEYNFYSYDIGTVKINLYFSPSLNFHNDEGLKYAISIDNEQPQVFSLNKDDNNVRTWENWVATNIIIKTSQHKIDKSGKHVLKYWMISPAVVLQKLVVDFGGMKPSYLGPPETKF